MSSVEEEIGLDGEVNDPSVGNAGALGAGNAGGQQGVFNNFNYVAPEHET